MANGAATQYVSPPVPLCPPSIRVSIHVRILQHTEHGTKTKTNQRINATNTRGEEWLIENLYHPVWYSFISGIYTGIIDSILHMCIILKHASTLRTVETIFSLSLSPRYPRGTIETFSGLDFRPCTSSSFFRRESSVKCD